MPLTAGGIFFFHLPAGSKLIYVWLTCYIFKVLLKSLAFRQIIRLYRRPLKRYLIWRGCLCNREQTILSSKEKMKFADLSWKHAIVSNKRETISCVSVWVTTGLVMEITRVCSEECVTSECVWCHCAISTAWCESATNRMLIIDKDGSAA